MKNAKIPIYITIFEIYLIQKGNTTSYSLQVKYIKLTAGRVINDNM